MQLTNNITISTDDYTIMDKYLKSAPSIKKVLEFGPGISTSCFLTNGCLVDTFEYDINYLNKTQSNYAQYIENKQLTVNKFLNVSEITLGNFDNIEYDLIFVDSPRGLPIFSRLNTLKYALDRCKLVLIHDIHRQSERDSINIMGQIYDITLNNLNEKLGLLTKT